MSDKTWYPGCATGRLLSCTPTPGSRFVWLTRLGCIWLGALHHFDFFILINWTVQSVISYLVQAITNCVFIIINPDLDAEWFMTTCMDQELRTKSIEIYKLCVTLKQTWNKSISWSAKLLALKQCRKNIHTNGSALSSFSPTIILMFWMNRHNKSFLPSTLLLLISYFPH